MDIKVVAGDIVKTKVDALIVSHFKESAEPSGATKDVDEALGGTISQLIADGEIKGKLKEITVIHSQGKVSAKRIVVLGLGQSQELTTEKIRQAIAECCRVLRSKGARRIGTIVHGAEVGGIKPETAAQAIVEGSILGLYTFRKHINKEPEFEEVSELVLIEGDKSISHLSQCSFCSSFLMYLGMYLVISILVPSSGPFDDLMDFLVLIINSLSRIPREAYYPLLMGAFQPLIFPRFCFVQPR